MENFSACVFLRDDYIFFSFFFPESFILHLTIDHLIDLIFKFHRVKDYIIYAYREMRKMNFFLTSVWFLYEFDSISLFWICWQLKSLENEKRHPTASSWVLQGFKRLRMVHLELSWAPSTQYAFHSESFTIYNIYKCIYVYIVPLIL